MKKYILAIDQGTTGSTALLMDLQGKIMGTSNERFKQIFPKPGWVEHNPQDILQSVKKSIQKVFELTKVKPEEVLTIGITNQRETVVFWDAKSGKAFGNAIVWQCRRTSKRTENIKKSKHAKWLHKKTGLNVDPYFSSTKIEWFLQQKSKPKNLCIGTIDTFLLYHLTGKKSFYTEPSNASRTQLYNIKTHKWDEEILKFFKISKHYLPEVLDSDSDFGSVRAFKPLVDGTPITGMLGDQQSALFGQGALKAGDVKCTFGTGSFILLNTGIKPSFSKRGLLTTVAWKLKNNKAVYALEGGAFNCGSCISWFRDEMGVISDSSEIDKVSKEVESANGVLFAPTFSGLGAPYWNPNVKGGFFCLSRDTKGAHLAKAVLEGLSFQNKLIFDSMEKDYGKPLKKIYIDGGASKSDEFMKIQSRFAGKKLVRPKNIETTAVGAALISGLGIGALKPQKKNLNPVETQFNEKPQRRDKETLQAYTRLFQLMAKEKFNINS